MAHRDEAKPGLEAVLLDRIRRRELRLAVIGLGYVGLPLALEFARSGFDVVGVEADCRRVEAVNAGNSYVGDVSDEDLGELTRAGRLRASADYASVAGCHAVVICVPTPLRKTKDPDLSFVVGSVQRVSAHMSPGKLVVLESTTYPGTTDELVRPILERAGLKAGRDFFLAFSPERVDPGPAYEQFNIRNVPKVVGGITSACTRVACAFYGAVVQTVVPVSNTRVAEMVKLLENTYRSVNIALVNELALMCHHLDLDVWEVIEAARTKPFGFEAFYPGPGLGGHCIPIDPFYLAWKARLHGFEPRFIDLAGQVNASMPRHVVELAADLLNARSKPLRGSRIHVLGAAYKKGVSDVRESPALIIMELLLGKGAEVSYSDPYVPRVRLADGTELCSVPIERCPLEQMDCVVIVTDHDVFPWEQVARRSPLILDTRNVLRDFKGPHVHKL